MNNVCFRGYHGSSNIDHVSLLSLSPLTSIVLIDTVFSTEHYIGITIASMPALKPLFTKILDSTMSSQSSSSQSFQKIKPANAVHFSPRSHPTSGRSSIRGNNIRKTTEFRVSSQLELEIDRDYELSDTGALPEYLRQSDNTWARGPGMEKARYPAMRTGGYRHIDEAPDFSPAPQTRSDVRS